MPEQRRASPAESVRRECARRNRSGVVDGCIRLLQGQPVDDDLLRALGGPAAEQIMGGRAGGLSGYWPRVWGARGLLYAWDESAVDAIVAATSDASWRVREMSLKVIARHRVGDGIDAAASRRTDEVARVRAAAERALVAITAAGA